MTSEVDAPRDLLTINRRTAGLMLLSALLPDIAFAAGGDAPEGNLRVGVIQLLTETFHPTWATVSRMQFLTPLYDHIVGADPDGKLDPRYGIAASWESSPDLLTWTFQLKEGIKFSNGSPVTAEDVAFTINEGASAKNTAGGTAFAEYA